VSTPSIEQELQELKDAYLASLPEKLSEMLQLLLKISQQPSVELRRQLQLLAHRIKGTAATYGFLKVAECAADMERSLIAAAANQSYPIETLEHQLEFLKQHIDSAQAEHFDRSQTVEKLDAEKLLVVDDDPDFLRFISTILAQQGFNVATISDPQKALNLIDEIRPELLLIDVDMPGMSGYQLCQLLRNDERTREMPIIFLTAHNTEQHRIEAFRAGADDFINKPIVTEELIARVDVRLARARLAREKQEILERLQLQNESLLTILDQLQIGTLMIDANDTVMFMSQSCQTLGGLSPQKAVGKSWRQSLPFDPKTIIAIARQLQGEESKASRLHADWRRHGKHYFVDIEIRQVPSRSELHLLYLYDQSELHQLRQQIEQSRFHQMLGSSEPMRQMFVLIEQVAAGNWTVLIEGETGVGKELVAHSIHAASPRKDKPFIAVNSAGLSETLLSSQLFGHRRGSFTGAVSDQEGFFEAASGGTLFLDEIGDIPLTMQAALLRVLQEKEITRLGESRTRKVDVRIIAATHKDLASEVRAGRFREDLLYRLRVARVYVPTLRERKEDIPMLAQAFLIESCRTAHIPAKHFAEAAMNLLQRHDWPGNVRELKATVDYAVIRSRGEIVTPSDLPPELTVPSMNKKDSTGVANLFSAPTAVSHQPMPLSADDERQRILNALEHTRGNRTLAAKLLGISRATFYRHLNELGISPPR